MKQKTFLTILVSLFSANLIFGQFVVKDTLFQPTGLSNEGLVAGYAEQAGAYYIWNPDSGTMENIAGLAPGNGIGGQARFSTDGNFLSGTSQGSLAPELSRYNHTTGQWTPLGSLGFMVDNTLSGGFGISGDGNTVVGLSWGDTTGGLAYAHAVAYNATEGIMDLGTLFAGRSTRANAASYDGSVVVGWQDFNGPWKSAVWRKNPNGGYFPNEYILIDTAGSSSDEYNQIGECSTVSADGNWIGGYGDYANNNEPWIWSQDSGVINLGTLPNVGTGYVSSMTADASIVVGWFGGQLFGDPLTPFIWTRANGIQELNAYINNVLGDSTGTHQVYTAEGISPDGHYIAGYGVDNSTFSSFIYRVSLLPPTGIRNVTEAGNIKIYPNPTASLLTIENRGEGVLTISGVDGKVIDKTEINGNHVLDISKYAPGIYSLSLQSGAGMQTSKFIKN